jgi:hypothetical protein
MNNSGELDFQRLIYSITTSAKTEFETRELYSNLPEPVKSETTLNTIARLAMEETHKLTVRELLLIHSYLVTREASNYNYQPGDDKIKSLWHHASQTAELELANFYA